MSSLEVNTEMLAGTKATGPLTQNVVVDNSSSLHQVSSVKCGYIFIDLAGDLDRIERSN